MTTLIVATDGSDLAIEAAAAGLSLTKPVESVLFVSVVDLIDDSAEEHASGLAGPTMTPEESDAHRRELTAEGQAALDATVDALRRNGSLPEHFEARVVEGNPGQTLCDLADDVGASGLILGTRGRGGLKRAFLGSVSDHVVRNAPCSVIVSRSHQH
jgi:nucleotide-binding universal stress UspA family protein